MRIIAGEFRGRTLLGPATDATRPVTDRAKQSIFDVLTARADPPIDGARVYDVFSGTGSFGLEAISRGAARATFFDADRSAVERLKRNVAALGVAGRCRVVPGDGFRSVARLSPPGDGLPVADRADLVFLDPPYRLLNDRPADLQRLAATLAADHLAPGGLVVFRHDAADALALPGLAESDDRTFGGMRVRFLSADRAG